MVNKKKVGSVATVVTIIARINISTLTPTNIDINQDIDFTIECSPETVFTGEQVGSKMSEIWF